MTVGESDVLIVGTGQAGAQAALSLRQEGFAGTITMLGEEADLPYERPPLSKDYLAGQRTPERLLLRPHAFWAERHVRIVPSAQVVRVEGHTAFTAEGGAHRFGRLVWAAGGHARRLSCPGGDLGGVHSIRTRHDCDNLRSDLHTAARVVIVGGGYIGLEAAAVLRGLGKDVTVVEAQPGLLSRVSAGPVSDFLLAAHRGHGVEVLTGAVVSAIAGEDRVRAVELADGRELAADVVIAGVGMVPSIAPLGVDALEVDGHCRTALPDVYAVGDCASYRSRFAGNALVRLESVQNAVDMAKAAAAHIVHGDNARPHDACPWFWSNQYDLKLQTVGLSTGHDEWVVRGDRTAPGWSLVYLRGGAVVALDCISAPRDYVQGKALVERGARIPAALLADSSVPLKQMDG